MSQVLEKIKLYRKEIAVYMQRAFYALIITVIYGLGVFTGVKATLTTLNANKLGNAVVSGPCQLFHDQSKKTNMNETQVIITHSDDNFILVVPRGMTDSFMCEKKNVLITGIALNIPFNVAPVTQKLTIFTTATVSAPEAKSLYPTGAYLAVGKCEGEVLVKDPVQVVSSSSVDFKLVIESTRKSVICKLGEATLLARADGKVADDTPIVDWTGKVGLVSGVCYPDPRKKTKFNPSTAISIERLPVRIMQIQYANQQVFKLAGLAVGLKTAPGLPIVCGGSEDKVIIEPFDGTDPKVTETVVGDKQAELSPQ